MSKVRVYELAKELGMDSKTVLAKLQDMGEFVRSASSTIEAPVARRLKEALPPVPEGVEEPAKKVAKKAVKKAAASSPDAAAQSTEPTDGLAPDSPTEPVTAIPAAAAPTPTTAAPTTPAPTPTPAPKPAPRPGNNPFGGSTGMPKPAPRLESSATNLQRSQQRL